MLGKPALDIAVIQRAGRDCRAGFGQVGQRFQHDLQELRARGQIGKAADTLNVLHRFGSGDIPQPQGEKLLDLIRREIRQHIKRGGEGVGSSLKRRACAREAVGQLCGGGALCFDALAEEFFAAGDEDASAGTAGYTR